jgi:antibiotic biosynthesis monooxygenase (ABM) superfamily enzyme
VPDDARHATPHPDEVTSVIKHHIKPGGEAEYEAWLREITPTAQRFPGHQGVNIVRPPAGADEYTIVLHFDTLEHAQAWLASDTRRTLLTQVEPLLVGGDQVEIKTGLEFWFTPSAGQQHAKPYKQFLLTLSAIFPLTMLVPWVLRPLFQAVPVLGLPGISNLLISAVIVGLMTYVIMPRYTRLVAGWLYENSNAAPKGTAGDTETRTNPADRNQP